MGTRAEGPQHCLESRQHVRTGKEACPGPGREEERPQRSAARPGQPPVGLWGDSTSSGPPPAHPVPLPMENPGRPSLRVTLGSQAGGVLLAEVAFRPPAFNSSAGPREAPRGMGTGVLLGTRRSRGPSDLSALPAGQVPSGHAAQARSGRHVEPTPAPTEPTLCPQTRHPVLLAVSRRADTRLGVRAGGLVLSWADCS